MSVIIIYPTELYSENSSELKGAVQLINNCVYFYVLNKFSLRNEEDIYNIGLCNYSQQNPSGNVTETPLNRGPKRKSIDETKPDWIELTVNNQSIDVARLIVNAKEYDVKCLDVTFVQYDRCSFLKSKLLNYSAEEQVPAGDCFMLLQRYVDQSHGLCNVSEEMSQPCLAAIIRSLQKILNVCRILKMFTFSSLCKLLGISMYLLSTHFLLKND